jgi:molybdate transport repressor ModE-like protein
MPNPRDALSPDALALLDAIGREGSFAAAARHLGLVPSALSYRVRQMEDALDVLLFDRSARQAVLTPAGAELLREGQRLLQDADAVALRVKRVATGWEPQLTIAADSVIAHNTLMELAEAFFTLQAPTRLRIREEVLTGTLEALVSGRADLALGVNLDASGATGLKSKPLGPLAFVYCVAHAHQQPGDDLPTSHGLARREALLQLRDQIGQRHIDKAAGGHHQKVRQPVVQLPHQKVPHQPAQCRHGAGQRHLDQRHARLRAGLAQHHQVAHVVRHLVGQHRKRGNHTQAQVGHEGRGDQDAVAKAMHAVAGEHRPAGARNHGGGRGHARMAVVVFMPCGWAWSCAPLGTCAAWSCGRAVPGGVAARLVAVLVAVVPQLGLVEQKEEHQAHQQRGKQVVGIGLASNASGSRCMKAVASRAPAARLSRCCGPTLAPRPP